MSEAELEQQKSREAKIEEKQIFKGAIFQTAIKNYTFKNRKTRQREIVKHNGAVICIPVLENQKLVLIKQYRHAIDRILIELPAGKLEPGESPRNCASRELQEEIGYKAETLVPLGGFFTTPGFCDEYIHIFAAKNLKKGRLPCDESEGIDPFEASVEKALELIGQKKIEDGKTIVALMRYLLWQKHFKLQNPGR